MTLSEFQEMPLLHQRGFDYALNVLLAEEELRFRFMQSPLSSGRLHELILATTGDRDLAESSRAKFELEGMKHHGAGNPAGLAGAT